MQMTLAERAMAQFATQLDLDRATVNSVVNIKRFVPLASDLTEDQDPGVVKASPTYDAATAASALAGPSTIASATALKPAISLPVNPNAPVSTPTGNFTVPAEAPSTIDGQLLAQANAASNASRDIVPIDLTPVRLPDRNTSFNGFDAFRTRTLTRLPGRVFFNFSLENSLRFEVNTFQTNRHYLSDMVYRVLPNITVGYALTPKTRIEANYFFLRDQYDKRNKQLSRNFQSVGGAINHDFHLTEKTTLTTGFMSRVLFINTSHQPGIVFNDLLPSFLLTRRVNNGVIYANVTGQIRFRDICAKFQEGDQFYTLGGAWRKNKWLYSADSTLVTNFGNSNLRQGPNNQNIIMTFEAGRQILPWMTAFARAQPIFNIGANHSPGYAGFNFRIFGGLRADVGKPPIFPIKLKS
ncbi:MAG: hypothetical protein JST01_12805 [Cyanobacteria bacterium SZAS TMP-1]|nr:hypothetical protein [Cyanobacteria bacterium SZAS TMP-1]